jgi:hypothetical protein
MHGLYNYLRESKLLTESTAYFILQSLLMYSLLFFRFNSDSLTDSLERRLSCEANSRSAS